MKLKIISLILTSILLSCNGNKQETNSIDKSLRLVVLGNVQDAGSPQIACNKVCCTALTEEEKLQRMVSCLGIIDEASDQTFLLDATPDIVAQLQLLNSISGKAVDKLPTAVFLTHAHIGHYTGLMYFGKEAINAAELDVYCMPNMMRFLTDNGPWSQLVSNKNISLKSIQESLEVKLNDRLQLIPICVPHRDEYSETVGYIIRGPQKNALFIPDIDKWNLWEHSIIDMIEKVDYAFVDATFYDNKEIPNRDMSEIPHPFVIESMALFDSLSLEERSKIYFIHLNHSNPLLNEYSDESKEVKRRGFNVARLANEFGL